MLHLLSARDSWHQCVKKMKKLNSKRIAAITALHLAGFSISKYSSIEGTSGPIWKGTLQFKNSSILRVENQGVGGNDKITFLSKKSLSSDRITELVADVFKLPETSFIVKSYLVTQETEKQKWSQITDLQLQSNIANIEKSSITPNDETIGIFVHCFAMWQALLKDM